VSIDANPRSGLGRAWPPRDCAAANCFGTHRFRQRLRRPLVEIVDEPLTFLEYLRGGTVKMFQLALQTLQPLKGVAHSRGSGRPDCSSA
jgi:hypothetical protein